MIPWSGEIRNSTTLTLSPLGPIHFGTYDWHPWHCWCYEKKHYGLFCNVTLLSKQGWCIGQSCRLKPVLLVFHSGLNTTCGLILLVSSWCTAVFRPENFRPEQDWNPDLCDEGAVLHQLSYQANKYMNRPFYSCMLRCLAFEWNWGWSWPCLDRNLSAFVM